MQTVSLENLYEMSDPIFEEKNQKKKNKQFVVLSTEFPHSMLRVNPSPAEPGNVLSLQTV